MVTSRGKYPIVIWHLISSVRPRFSLLTALFCSCTLPKINDVRGAFNVQSSGDLTKDCSTFDGQKGSNMALKGDYQCAGKQSNPGDSGSTTSSSSGSGKTGAANHLDMPSTAVYTGVLGVLAAMMGML